MAFLQGVLGIRWGRQVALFSFGLSCAMCGHLIPLPAGILDCQADAHHTGNGWYFPAFPGWSLWAGTAWRSRRVLEWGELSRLGARWVLWSQARGVKKGRCHCKAEVSCSVPCLEGYLPKGQEVLPCSPKGCVSGWESVPQPFRSSIGIGLHSRALPVPARGIPSRAACTGAQPCPLGREQRQCLGWGPDRKDPLLLRVYVCVSVNPMYFDQGMHQQSASHQRRCSSEMMAEEEVVPFFASLLTSTAPVGFQPASEFLVT